MARQEGVAASLLFQWRKLDRQGGLTAVSAGEAVVPASELAADRAEIAKLQRVLRKKTLENEVFKEAVEYAAEKGGLRARMCMSFTAVLTAAMAARGARRRVVTQPGLLLPKAPLRHHASQRHEGTVVVWRSDQRWCSDGLEIECESGQTVTTAFAKDFCVRPRTDRLASL